MKKSILILFAVFLFSSVSHAAVTTNPDVTGIPVGGVGGDATTLDGYSSAEFFNRENHTGFQIASTISDFNDAVIATSLSSGIESHTAGDDTPIKVTRNVGNITQVDIAEGDCHIQGNQVEFAAITSVDPEFGIGSNSKWFGCGINGLVKQDTKFTAAQKRTIMPVARIQAAGSQTGAGSDISDLGIWDHRYLIHEDDFRWEAFLDGAFGSLFQTGGLITENSVTDRNLDVSAGILWNSDRGEQSWGSFTNLSGLYARHIGGAWVVSEITQNMDNVNYDNGTDLTAMTNNNYHCSHTLLMTPRGTQDADFDRIRTMLVHCQAEYPDLQGAIDAGIDFGPWSDEQTSGLTPLAQVITKKNSSNIIAIIDARNRVGTAGGSISTAATTLQGAYNNSSPGSPEIILNDAQDGFTIRDSSTGVPDGVLFRVEKANGDAVLNITTSFAFPGSDVSGVILQTMYRSYSSVATGSSNIPLDDSTPQNNEGNEFMSVDITPTSSDNKIYVTANAFVAGSTSQETTMAIFRGDDPNAVAAMSAYQPSVNEPFFLHVEAVFDVVSSGVVQNYNAQIGMNSSGTVTFNGGGGTRRLGPTIKSTLIIEEGTP